MTAAAEPVRAEGPLWRPMVGALGKTGGASIASGLLGALGTKIVASLLGPGSIALLQTLQQLRDGALIVATANGRSSLVQGASELEGAERREFVRTAAALFSAATLGVAVGMLLAPRAIAQWSRLPEGSESLLPWVALAVALLSVYVFFTAILNAIGDIGILAWLQLVSPLTAALIAWPVAESIRGGASVAIAAYLAIPAAASVVAGLFALWSHGDRLRDWIRGVGRLYSASAGRHFFSISGAMLASGLAATAVLLSVRGFITRHESMSVTGQFDAAWNISMNHATLILSSIQAYYLPSLSAARTHQERTRQVRAMMVVASLATAPVIVALVCLKPLAVSILYSQAFTASPRFLRWTLLGDYFKVSAWVLITPMLAARHLAAFLAVDLVAQAAFWGGARLFGRVVPASEAASIGFLVANALCFAFCLAYARTRQGIRLGVNGTAAWVAGLVLVSSASAYCWHAGGAGIAGALAWIAAAITISAAFAVYLRRREP